MYRDNGQSTAVSLRMTPYDAQFIVFQKAAEQSKTVAELTKDDAVIRSVTSPVSTLMELSPMVRARDGETELTVWASGQYELGFDDGSRAQALIKDLPAPQTVEGSWSVSFPENRGGPADAVTFDTLESWTQRPEAGIKYFSGTASYRKSIELDEARLNANRSVLLDLGEVSYLAEVFVNDQPLGLLWKKPFRVDISDA